MLRFEPLTQKTFTAHVWWWSPTSLTITSFQNLCLGNGKLAEFLNSIKLHLLFNLLSQTTLAVVADFSFVEE